jgi:cellulose synthase/poly-beta-1,6-N-acetylglucosamine synthase-like glycosyltransferase
MISDHIKLISDHIKWTLISFKYLHLALTKTLLVFTTLVMIYSLFIGPFLLIYRRFLAFKKLTVFPSVTILRPLKGIDDNLFYNLESSFLQTYTNFEIMLCVADSQDPCITLCRDLMTKYPHVKSELLIGFKNC